MSVSKVVWGTGFAYRDLHGRVQMTTLHRFAEPWEAEASLQLRGGNPQAIDAYDQYNRIHAGTATEKERDILEAWPAARQRGETVALMANRNETVRRLDQQCQHQLINMGQLDTTHPSLEAGSQTLYEGDEVVTRLNYGMVQTDERKMVKNRDH